MWREPARSNRWGPQKPDVLPVTLPATGRHDRARLALFAPVAALLTMLLIAAPVAASSPTQKVSPVSPDRKAVWQKASAEGAGLVAAARALEVYLVRNPDGTMGLNAPRDVVDQLPSRYVRTLSSGLDVLNAKVVAGELQTRSAGAIFDPEADPMTLQGGWTGSGYTWWGRYYCLSHEDLRALGEYPNWIYVATVFAVIAAIPEVGGAIDAFVFLYLSWMAWADNGNGSCLNATWAGGPYWVTSQ